jgi:hypothetical protein
MRESMKVVIVGEVGIECLSAFMSGLEEFRAAFPERVKVHVQAVTSDDVDLSDAKVREALAILHREGAL